MENVPAGLCQCGCGLKTSVYKVNCKPRGHIKGQTARYIHGHNARKYSSAEESFWKHVTKKNIDECWDWMGTIETVGYGILSFNKKKIAAHRFSYEIHKGPIPQGLLVRHTCDRKICVNPNHLLVGTDKDNSDDRDKRNRQARGSTLSKSNFTDDIIREIRATHAEGIISNRQQAIRLGVNHETINLIVNRKIWKHVR